MPLQNQSLTRRFAFTVALVQLGAGITGLMLADTRFRGSTYQPAKQLLSFLPGDPGYWWSGLLLILSAAAVVLLCARSSSARTAFALLCGYWTFWAVLYAWAWPSPGSGPWAPWLAAMCAVGNARPVVTHTPEQ